ncbi:MAG: hypothetical protein ABEI06_10270, partial [Halobacteriaceae archaeon]
MIRNNSYSTVLLGLGIVFLIIPIVFPFPQVLYHSTRPSIIGDASKAKERGFKVVSYDNLSDRAQELYIQTLQHDGEYSVPVG